MKNTLIVGANGQLGSEIRIFSGWRDDIFFTDLPDLDICNHKQVEEFVGTLNIGTIINCAAYTKVDKAESEIELSNKINIEGPANLARVAKKHDSTLIHISTDYVFDGKGNRPLKESDPTNPLTQYGKSKRAGELAVIDSGCKSIIIRTAWLYSSFGSNFVKSIINLALQNTTINVVDDQIGSPTYARDLANAILQILPQLVKTPRYGEIFNYTNEGSCSWYEFASLIVRLRNLSCSVYPIKTDHYPTAAQRPHYSVLNKTLIRDTFGVETPSWEKSLGKMIKLL